MLMPTPTTNPELAFRLGGFETLAEGLDYAAQGETGMNFYSPRGELQTVLPYRRLRAEAIDAASRLPSARLRRGDRIGIIAETTPDFLLMFFACQYAGMIPVPLPLAVNFGGRQAYAERIRGMLLAAGARAAIGPADLVEVLHEATRRTAVSFVGTAADVSALERATSALEPLAAHEACYIQYSSGSTSFPRGVLVTQQAITANARSIAVDGVRLHNADRCVSWLPLYHDMGLVGCCLTPVLSQTSVDYLATSSFARRPLVWLELISRNKGTIAFSPTFGFELCARRASNRSSFDFDLSSWRVAGIGGEMIRPEALDTFIETFAANGFDGGAFLASYGMAEATLAVTFPEPGTGVAVDRILRGEELEQRRLAVPAHGEAGAGKARSFARCGRPMPGYEVEIRDRDNRPLADRHVGRICIRGPSLMGGYFRNPEATEAVITRDGWLDSGDMGYMVGGELVVTGRTKDLIIIGGRNIWPQDLEWAVEQLPDVRAGDVAAFSGSDADDREQVIVVVECRLQEDDAIAELRERVRATISRVAGVESEVVLAPPRSLTFTTSGKLSRAAARQNFIDGAIRDIRPDGGLPHTVPASVDVRIAASG
ncbi:MAG: fatty acyl-AMP ligase [Geminicoccaceae bacterium]